MLVMSARWLWGIVDGVEIGEACGDRRGRGGNSSGGKVKRIGDGNADGGDCTCCGGVSGAGGNGGGGR